MDWTAEKSGSDSRVEARDFGLNQLYNPPNIPKGLTFPWDENDRDVEITLGFYPFLSYRKRGLMCPLPYAFLAWIWRALHWIRFTY